MYYAIIAAVIALDQISKCSIQAKLALNHTIPIVDGIFHFTYIHNYGAAFSILENKQGFLLMVTGIVLLLMLGYLIKERKKANRILLCSLSLIIGGGLGNLIDRIRLGYVIDFFDFRIWPIFNVADISVVCGCVLLMAYVFYFETRGEAKKS